MCQYRLLVYFIESNLKFIDMKPSHMKWWNEALSRGCRSWVISIGCSQGFWVTFSHIENKFCTSTGHGCVYSVTQSCLTLCDILDCSPQGASFLGVLQARMLEWVVISSSRESSRPRDRTHISCISCTGRQILYHCATWEAPHKQISNLSERQSLQKRLMVPTYYPNAQAQCLIHLIYFISWYVAP